MRISFFLIALVSGTHLVAGTGHANCIRDHQTAVEVAKLYPTGDVGMFALSPGTQKSCRQVSPIQRDGKWGFVDQAFKLPIEGGYTLLAFEFLLGADSKEGVHKIREFDHLKDEPIEARQGVQVILLNKAGKFVDKPINFPLLDDMLIGCMGDMCSYSGVRLVALKPVPGSKRAAYIEYESGGRQVIMAFHWVGGDLASSRPENLGILDDLSGCDRGTRLERIEFKGGQVVATLVDECNVEACPEDCRDLGLSAKRPEAVPRQVTMVGTP